MSPIRCCERCEFWVELDPEFDDGECRCLPPVMLADGEGIGVRGEFPLVGATCWCGQFKAKSKESSG